MSERSVHITAVILAAGSGTRMRSDITKQMMKISGECVLCRSVRAFEECDSIDSVIVVAKAEEIPEIKEMLSHGFNKLVSVVSGGSCRQESAKIGFLCAGDKTDFVAIHDAARCLITPQMIERVAVAAIEHGAATASTPVTDTLKQIKDGCAVMTVPRENMISAQTPQIFRRELYERALSECDNILDKLTDDNMLLEKIGMKVYAVDTGKENIKITTPDDIDYAEFIIGKRNK